MIKSHNNFYLWLINTAFILLLLIGTNISFAAASNGIKFTQAEVALIDNSSNPTQQRNWQAAHFPDIWKLSHPNFHGTAWYRLHFNFNSDPNKVHALYIVRLSMNCEVYLNGVKIGDGGSSAEPVSRNWNRPLLFVIPPSVLKPSNNDLLIKVTAPQYTQGMLYPPEIDRLENLQPRYDDAKFVRITLNQTASLLIIGIGLLMLSLWWRRKKDSAYGLFGLAALIWALQSLNFYITKPLFSTALWEIFINASFEIIGALWLISLLSFAGIKAKHFNLFLIGLLILSPITLLLAPAPYFMALTDILHFLTLSAVLIGLVYLAIAWIAHQNKDAKLLLATISTILVFATHDWLIHTNLKWLNQLFWGSEEYLMQFSAPVLFLIVGFMMTSRYVKALNNYEVLNEELEQRVISKHNELDEKFKQIQLMLKEQAALEERERIYQDLHDDVGAKLLTLVYRAQDSNNAELARSALQDLRDVVSYTSTGTTPLAYAMADYRIECEHRLSDVNIKLHWTSSVDDKVLQLTQPQALNLGRIIREAASNIIRHANAKQVIVAWHIHNDYVLLSIDDDGIGLPSNQPNPSQGRGLANIKKRSGILGGEVSMLNSPLGGLSLEIKLPLSTFNNLV
jgi:signal transduction histidine kinase